MTISAIRLRYPHLPDYLDLGAVVGMERSVDQFGHRQHQLLATLDRAFEYQERLETGIRILQAREKRWQALQQHTQP